MDFSGQIQKLFTPPERLHPPTAELSIPTGTCRTQKDFAWVDTNVPCRKACPADTDIPGYLTAIAEGRYTEAYRQNLIDNVFPAVLGRVCSRPCEAACRHGYEGLGESVAICFSKRSAADFAAQELVVLEPWFGPTGRRVAVIGAGVAGLTIARNLALFGHQVTCFEKQDTPGGMLNQGIPEFRLPRDVIAREIDQLLAVGIDLRCGTAIGRDLHLTDLTTKYDAVVMAAGTLLPNWLDLPGRDLPGIRHGLDFLLEVNDTGTARIGRRVLVIGGGFTAMDCARTAQRLGAETAELSEDGSLQVLYRRTPDELRVTPGELEELAIEGVPLECHATPIAFEEKNGRLTGMRFRRTGTDEAFTVPADTVLLATGQFPDHDWTGDPTAFGRLENFRKIFTAGDYALGATSLIDAIGHAKKTAEEVDYYLQDERRMRRTVRVEEVATTGRTRAMDERPRELMPTLPVESRGLPDEVELGYDREAAVREAERCYRCHFKFEIDQDKCIKCDWCLKARPRPECILMLKDIRHDEEGRVVDWEATERVRDMNLIWINPDECIRCGACLEACPVDAIDLQKVSLCNEPVIAQTDAESPKEPS